MAPEIEEQEDEGGGDEWMTTFADLMSLLLTFFILLLSFANMDVIKFRDAQGSLKDAFGVQFDDTIKGEHRTKAASIVDLMYKTKDSVINLELESRQSQGAVKSTIQARMQSNEDIYRKLQSIVRDQNLGDQVVVENTSRGVIITVNGQLFFHSGSEVLREESFPLLDSITNVITEFPYKLNVEGHTDNTQIKTDKFPSNWELSAGRAISAVKYILSSGQVDPEKLGAGGYAETRPIAQNDTPEGRRINRRIEFVFFRDDMEIKEFEDFQQKDAEGEDPKTKEVDGNPAKGPETSLGAGKEGEGRTQPVVETSTENGAAAELATTRKDAPITTEPSVSSPPKEGLTAPTEATNSTPQATAPVSEGAKPAPAKATPGETPKEKAIKRGILKPINLLSPIGITPESVEKPANDVKSPAPTRVKTKSTAPATAPTKTQRPSRQRATKKSTAPAKPATTTTPAKTEPYVPGKFSAPTD